LVPRRMAKAEFEGRGNMARIDRPRGVASRGGLASVAAAGCLAVLALVPAAAPAATITVNTTADVHGTLGNCSLREAISSANLDGPFGGCASGSGNDTIVIPGGTYRLMIPRVAEAANGTDNTEGDLDVTDVATLHPRFPLDRVIIDGNGAVTDDRVLQTSAVGDGLTIEGLTLRGGSGGVGGGIFGEGGGAVLTLNRVTVVGNSGTNGGGIIHGGGGASTLAITNSTIAGNSASGFGGGLNVGSALATLRNVTLAGNTADSDNDGSGDGGGLEISGSAPVTLQSTLMAGNADRSGEAPDCFIPGGSLTSAGNSLIGDLTGCTYTAGPGDITGVAPRLGPLAFNGGPNETRALRPGSPAINRGGQSCEPTDQRGLPRGFGGRCDIGAYELARCAGAIVNRVGTPGPNRLVGTNGRDGILGLAGNDRLFGRGGNDSLCGQGGFDRLFGQGGFDRLLGGAQADRLFGGAKADRLFGGPGFDRLFGQRGFDRLFGGPGRDLLNGQRGRDRCHGGPGRDRARRCAVRRRIG
jgi:CSLREA domain-containing protein